MVGASTNIRARLDWAFSPSGDVSIGVALTAASCRSGPGIRCWSNAVDGSSVRLARVQPGSNLDARHAMRLHAALGWALNSDQGPPTRNPCCLGEGA